MGLFLWKNGTQPEPNIGEEWVLRGNDGDPFEPKRSLPAKILDIKGGWVRYSIGASRIFCDERMRVSMFVRLYRKIGT